MSQPVGIFGQFRPALRLSTSQRLFVSIALAGTLALCWFASAKALHQHDYWFGVIDIPANSQDSSGDATIQHYHAPFQFLSDAMHRHWHWPPCCEMFGVKSRYIYNGTHDSGWYLGASSAYASVNLGTNLITWADGVYTHKINGAWTWVNYYSAMLTP